MISNVYDQYYLGIPRADLPGFFEDPIKYCPNGIRAMKKEIESEMERECNKERAVILVALHVVLYNMMKLHGKMNELAWWEVYRLPSRTSSKAVKWAYRFLKKECPKSRLTVPLIETCSSRAYYESLPEYVPGKNEYAFDNAESISAFFDRVFR